MKSQARPYVVTSKIGEIRLVQALNQAQALRHVARDTYQVRVALAVDVIALMQSGVQPEMSGDDKESAE